MPKTQTTSTRGRRPAPASRRQPQNRSRRARRVPADPQQRMRRVVPAQPQRFVGQAVPAQPQHAGLAVPDRRLCADLASIMIEQAKLGFSHRKIVPGSGQDAVECYMGR